MKRIVLAFFVLSFTLYSQSQTSADFMKAWGISDCTIAFDINAPGQEFRVNWGMDTAWDSEANVIRGINHIGKENFSTGRLSFQPSYIVKTNSDGSYELTDDQKKYLSRRIRHLKLTGVTEANINCDNAFALETLSDGKTGFDNYTRKVNEWYKLIKASVAYCQENGMKIISISPYNEPDLDENKYWWKSDFYDICKLIRQDPFFDGIRLCGGNTLNTDRAWDWYESLRDVIEEGNTHQLAGSFDNYANFFTKVRAEGKLTANDELHNVGEAIIGVNYGMQTGIWWGFDSHARGQFCHDSQEGVRLAYGEDRAHWTGGAVYRNEKTGEIHGFLGSSERQANNSTYHFVSTAQDVYFNGYGPTRLWSFLLPGGTGYQQGQIGAEMCIDITYGSDVAPDVINGTYSIMNLFSKKLLTMNGSSEVQCSTKKNSGTTQHWLVQPQKLNGDCSFHTIDNSGNTDYHLNLKNWNLNAGATVITWKGDHGDLEQWYLKYAQNGYYYIVNRYSNKYLYCPSISSGTILQLANPPAEDISETMLRRYLWRFQPIDAQCETDAPSAPSTPTATIRTSSISLAWEAPSDEDVVSYNILRSDNGEWNTIGRNDTLTTFIDNTAQAGHTYQYRIVAVDYAGNRSEPSESTEYLTLLPQRGLICQLQFDRSLEDFTANHLDASVSGTAKYTNILNKSGTSSLSLSDANDYVMLPYSIASNNSMTVATWVRLNNASRNTRLFDFGSSSENYMCLTINTGTDMAFVIKNNGKEEQLGTGDKFSASTWRHLAVTIKSLEDDHTKVCIFVDGEEIASKDDFTIRPSDIKSAICYIGRDQSGNAPRMKGFIDDFRIYNYALTSEDISKIMEDLEGIASDYEDISETIGTSIDTLQADKASHCGSQAIYSLGGQLIGSLQKGINIIVNSDGTTKKVIVR